MLPSTCIRRSYTKRWDSAALIGTDRVGADAECPVRSSWRRCLVTAAVLRFGLEFLRVNERVAFGLSVAHLFSLAVIVLGGTLIAHPTRRTVHSFLDALLSHHSRLENFSFNHQRKHACPPCPFCHYLQPRAAAVPLPAICGNVLEHVVE